MSFFVKSNEEDTTSITTRSKCSSYSCENVESHPREFKVCSLCEIVKYCSRECQIQHWKDGHKKISKKIRKKKKKEKMKN